MSHIATAPHGGRVVVGTLPRSHASSPFYEHGDNIYNQGHDERYETHMAPYDGRYCDGPVQHGARDTGSTKHNKDHPHLVGVWQVSPEGQRHTPVVDRVRPNYKPSALRWPFLTSLLAILLALVALLGYALHALPVLDVEMDVLSGGLDARAFKRQASASEFLPSTVTDDAGATSTRPQSDFGDVGTVTVSESVTVTPIIASTKPTEDFGKVGSVTVTASIASSKASGDYGDVGTVSVTQPTVSGAPPSDHGMVGTVGVTATLTQQLAPTFVTPQATVLTDAQGIPTATSTSTPAPVSTLQSTTLTNSLGQPTASQVTIALVTPSVTVATNAQGMPTATITSYPVIPTDENVVVTTTYISYGQYFLGAFFPTLVAILLAIPIRILNLNAKIFQPWHELTHAQGVTGRESLCLQTGGWRSVVTSVRSLFGGQALVFLTTVLTLASSLLIPLSAEAVALSLHGSCTKGGGTAKNCAYELSVFSQAAKSTLALLAMMGFLVLLIVALLLRWQSGVSTNPWSICGVASLSLNRDVRDLFTGLPAGIDAGKMPEGLLDSVIGDRIFQLGYFYNANEVLEYGIMLHDGFAANHPLYQGRGVSQDQVTEEHPASRAAETKHHLPFLMLGFLGRILFLSVLGGLLALVLYYNNTGGDTPFERFMASESFGVRFLFTGVGVVISFFWASFFNSIAIMSPYQQLAQSPQQARRSILVAPPTNAFSGLWSSIRRRHGFLAVVALTSILSEFLTIFLGNIPFRVTQTFLVHNICTWTAVGIICIMVLVVLCSFFLKWPHMPVDPSTVAGAMYYVCDSWMLSHFEGLSTLDKKERDWKVNGMGLRYEFGEMDGVSGTRRVGIDASEGGIWDP
ncbi:Uu.00g077470.m01.CDS01 [Anthostomella pinea]|uniref:Uu.00g077470.m01.CDS01 n=1 Tax=Anthostomella pinea TaxID=933095 RepID=A0AAI8YLY0_9PEZI|nr:Uu.00g077470.m01.CDS01 [Anthostomella pinea]